MSILEEETVQTMGFITVLSLLGPNGIVPYEYRALQQLVSVKCVMPDRCGCVHFCTDSAIMFPVLQVLALMAPRHARARFRHHYGGRYTNFPVFVCLCVCCVWLRTPCVNT